MNRITLATLVSGALLAPFPALAQDDAVVVLQGPMHLAASEAHRAAGESWSHWAQDYSRQMHESMGSMFGPRLGSGKIVKGAPYSAEIVTETSQTLADGNVISKRTQGAIFRDGEGRTRQETAVPEGKSRAVYISDPVAHMSYVLTPNAKRAVGIATAPRAVAIRNENKEKQVVRVNGSEVRVEDGKVFLDGKEVTTGRVEVVKGGKTIVVDNGKITIDGKPIGEGGDGKRVVVHRVETEDGTTREEVRVQVVRPGEAPKDVVVSVPSTHVAPVPPVPPVPPVAAIAPLPGVQTLRFDTARLGKGVTTSLGMKDFDGVKAEGKSTTWTIPAGEIGNRNPINIMSESWYSPDLQVTVYSRHADPRTGESIYRLSSIRRGEPAPELFKVPEDYNLKSRPKG